jgi:hypothetical protein
MADEGPDFVILRSASRLTVTVSESLLLAAPGSVVLLALIVAVLLRLVPWA